MIEEPGSFSGINSPIPERGPEANIRMSFAILFNKQPIVLMRHVILQLHHERRW
jgi:hypothetical protein